MKVRDALRLLKEGHEVLHDTGMSRYSMQKGLATSRFKISRHIFEGLQAGGHLRHAYTDGAVKVYGWSGAKE